MKKAILILSVLIMSGSLLSAHGNGGFGGNQNSNNNAYMMGNNGGQKSNRTFGNNNDQKSNQQSGSMTENFGTNMMSDQNGRTLGSQIGNIMSLLYQMLTPNQTTDNPNNDSSK